MTGTVVERPPPGTGTVVSKAELVAAGSWLPRDFLAREGLTCHLCGLTPANVHVRGRPNPRTALLEPGGVRSGDPLRRSVYQCRNRAACERRQTFREGR